MFMVFSSEWSEQGGLTQLVATLHGGGLLQRAAAQLGGFQSWLPAAGVGVSARIYLPPLSCRLNSARIASMSVAWSG